MFTMHLGFFVSKKGGPDHDWEDAVAVAPHDPATGDAFRFAVADGATEAYDARRWANFLTHHYLWHDPPRLDRDSMIAWLGRTQYRWQAMPPAVLSPAAERKAAEGSYATLLCGEIADWGGEPPRWIAVGVGDVVLFQVREGRLVRHFPPLRPADFDNEPNLVHSRPGSFGTITGPLHFDSGELRVGDQLYVATDALAKWMLEQDARHGHRYWRRLDEVDHPETFRHWIAVSRHNAEIVNDDVSLLRMWLVEHEPSEVVLCR